MSDGCFSWCRPLRRYQGSKRQNIENEIVKVAGPVAVADIFKEPETDENLPGRTVVPTAPQYIIATGKQALELLQSAAGVIPVPLLKEAIGVAMNIIKVCDEASAVQQNVKELQKRVSHLMIIIVDNVTVKYEEGSEVVVKAVKDIENDIEDLLRTLKMIDRELTEVRQQNRWLQGLYTNLNMDAIESCLKQLSTAQEKFKLANDLRDSNLLLELHARLNNISQKIDDIHEDVKNVGEDVKHMANKVENISTYLFKSKRSTTLSSDTVVRHQIPLKPEIFHGRVDLVEEIARLLVNKETAYICLLGPGGMGKTSVSLAVVELPLISKQFPGGNCVWVPCIEATSAALLVEILYIQLQVPGDRVTLEKIIIHLNGLEQPCLILLDNFETPWNAPGTGTQKQIEDILRQLAKLTHIAIFITMRGRIPPCSTAIKWQLKTIEPADEEACLRIYHDNNPSSKDSDADIVLLLKALGYMPFGVTLMAKLGLEGMSTAKELLDAWCRSGPGILSDKPEESMDHSISLSVESDLIKRNPNAYTLLSILSLLPAGTTKHNLRWWAPDSTIKTSMIPSAIATLGKAALLVENKRENTDSPILFVVPVVQSFMQQHDRIEEKIRTHIQSACCQYVLDHACRYDDPTFPDKTKALAAEDTNIQSILFSSRRTNPSDRTIEALIAFGWHHCDTKPDPEIVNQAVRAARVSGVKKYIVSAIWCLGCTYGQLGDDLSYYSHLQEAYTLSNDPSAGDVELQRLHCKCGLDLVDAARMTFEDQSKLVSLARDLEIQCAALSDDHVHGMSLVTLGAVLNPHGQRYMLGHREEALEHLNRALIMLTENTTFLAYQTIARVQYYSRRFTEALDAIQEAWKLVESKVDPSSLLDVCLESAKIHFSANRDIEAWKHVETALMKASQIGNRYKIGRALELMGYGYIRKGDYENACGAYEAAAEKYHGIVNDPDAETRCKENMARIKRKQGDRDAEVGFFRDRMDVEKSLFYPQAHSDTDSNNLTFHPCVALDGRP